MEGHPSGNLRAWHSPAALQRGPPLWALGILLKGARRLPGVANLHWLQPLECQMCQPRCPGLCKQAAA